MGITEVAKGGLWTPEGIVDLRQKDITPVTHPMERQTWARFHEIAHKYGLSVVCQRCDCAITGQNNDQPGSTMSVACRCREWRFVV